MSYSIQALKLTPRADPGQRIVCRARRKALVEFHQIDIRSPDIQPLFGGVDAVYVGNMGAGQLQHQSAIASSLVDRLSLLPAAA